MLNVFFAGTPECAVPALSAIAQHHRITGILTNPPAPVGRKKILVPSAVAQAAEALKAAGTIPPEVPIFTPEKLDAEFRNNVAGTNPDIMVCFAFGRIFGPQMLSLFPCGALNIHPSLLPRWRGPSPVAAAVAAGDKITGVTVQYMGVEMDAGDILIQRKTEICAEETAAELLNRCAKIGSELIIDVLRCIETGTVCAAPQSEEGICYCRLIKKEDGKILWQQSAAEIDRHIRAYTPWPGAFTAWNGTQLTICRAHPYSGTADGSDSSRPGLVLGVDKEHGILIQTGSGILAAEVLQRHTKKAMHWKDFLNGAPRFFGQILGLDGEHGSDPVVSLC